MASSAVPLTAPRPPIRAWARALVGPWAELPPLLFAGWVAIFTFRGHLPYIENAYQQNIDEGYLLAIGQRMLHGKLLPFVDGVAHSGPLFLATALPMVAVDEFSWLPVRLAAAAGFVAVVALIYLVGRVIGYPTVGALASAIVPIYSNLYAHPIDGIAYNAELPVAVFSLLGMVLAAALAWRRPASVAAGVNLGDVQRWEPWCAFGCGLSLAAAALAKQIGVPLAGIIALGLVTTLFSQRERRAALRLVVWGLLGASAPVGLLLWWYARHDALADLLYYVVTYNRDIYMGFIQPSWRRIALGWLGFPALTLFLSVLGIGASLARGALRFLAPAGRASESGECERCRRAWVGLLVSLLTLAALVGAGASKRFFVHYYVLVLPWAGLLVALELQEIGSRFRSRAGLSAVILLATAAVLEGQWVAARPLLSTWRYHGSQSVHQSIRPPDVCAVVSKFTAPAQPLFVWGFRPELYVSCARRPASRFVFTSFVAGYVPWYGSSTLDDEDKYAVPGSRELLLRELEAAKPPVIVDAFLSLHGRSLRRYALLRDYLDAHYDFYDEFEGDFVYVRRSAAESLLGASL